MTDVQLLVFGALIAFLSSIFTSIITMLISYWIKQRERRDELINAVSQEYAYGQFRFDPTKANITQIARDTLPDVEKLSMTELNATMGHIRAQTERAKEQRDT